MVEYFETIKGFILDMGYVIAEENSAEQLVVINDEEKGIKNLVIDCEDPIVVLEQIIMEVPKSPNDLYKKLLQMNRTLVHGAFVLDEEGRTVIFRDTLCLKSLDRNELEGSIEALSLALAENAEELLSSAKT